LSDFQAGKYSIIEILKEAKQYIKVRDLDKFNSSEFSPLPQKILLNGEPSIFSLPIFLLHKL